MNGQMSPEDHPICAKRMLLTDFYFYDHFKIYILVLDDYCLKKKKKGMKVNDLNSCCCG